MTANDQVQEEASSSDALTPKQEQLIAVLVAGINIATAAKSVGIADKTARRWLKLPHFQRAYRKAQSDLFTEALQGLQDKIEKAITTLDRNMDGELTPPATQVRAAQIVIEQAIAVGKVLDLEQRLIELEELLKHE